jgi:E1A/CREB-binding protein
MPGMSNPPHMGFGNQPVSHINSGMNPLSAQYSFPFSTQDSQQMQQTPQQMQQTRPQSQQGTSNPMSIPSVPSMPQIPGPANSMHDPQMGSMQNMSLNSIKSELQNDHRSEPMLQKQESIKLEPMEPVKAVERPPSSVATVRKSPPPPVQVKHEHREDLVEEKKFEPHELRSYLKPICDKLLAVEESIPFRVPVDAELLKIPDYYDIVKRPMDLQTVERKLDKGDYRNPWEFCDDMWLMFENAWLYNKKNSKVYKFCTKLNEMFIESIDPVMKEMGYCCGLKLSFTPLALICYGAAACSIARDASYYMCKYL